MAGKKRHAFRVYEKVRGQARARSTRRGIHYKPATDRAYERAIREAYINSGGPNFGAAPLSVEVIAHRALPGSYPKRITSEMDVHKPDASNILKSVEDALNGIAYRDDAQLVDVRCAKAPRVRLVQEYLEITIEEVEQ